MPDLKTEMGKVLNAWEEDAQKPPRAQRLFTPTNNVTRATFDYVKRNPNTSHKQICDAMAQRGFKQSSVGSLVTQFTKQGMLARDSEGRYFAVTQEYVPLKSTKKYKAEGKRKNKIVKSPRSSGIAALKVEPKLKKKEAYLTGVIPSAVPAPVVTTAWDAETIISNIGLKQAHKLFLELQTYFGG